MNQFSDKYYLQIQQTFGGAATGFTLPRLKNLDDLPVLTNSDIISAEYRADMAGKAGTFKTGYYEVNLYEFYDTELVDSEIHIL